VDRGNARIQKFSGGGSLLAQWGTAGAGNGQFTAPQGIAVSAAGEVYVADSTANRIQKFTGVGVYVTQWGSTGTGQGQFSSPIAVDTDPSGNVYVIESGGSRVQKFSSTGTFLAQWGAAGAADGQFQNLESIAIDPLGFVYVGQDNRIQKFTGSGTFIGKFGLSGSGAGNTSGARGLAFDAEGNLYVSDSNNSRLEKFSGAGVAASLAAPQYLLESPFLNGMPWGPIGLAVDAAGFVFATDAGNACLEKFASSGAFVSQLATNVTANPYGVAVDGSGFLYVADQAANLITKLDSNGAAVTSWGSAGTGNGQFSNPQRIAVGAAGRIYVTDYGNHRVQVFSNTGAYVTQWGSFGTGSGQFLAPSALAVDGAGNVYVGDATSRVQKFTSNGVYLSSFNLVAGYVSPTMPNSIAIGPGNSIFTSDNSDQVQVFSSAGVPIRRWLVTNLLALAADPAGNILVASSGALSRFATDGTLLARWGLSGSTNGQFATAVDATGNAYVADADRRQLVKLGPTGTNLTGQTLLSNWLGYYPGGVALDAAGQIYFSDTRGGVIKQLDSYGSLLADIGLMAGLNMPLGLAVRNGIVYVADSGNNRIELLDAALGTPVQLPYHQPTGTFSSPAGVAVDAQGSIYVADTGNNRIQKLGLDRTGGSYTWTPTAQWGSAGTGAGQFNAPTGVAVDSSGYVYVSDSGNNRVQVFTGNGTFLAQWGAAGTGPGQFGSPRGVATDAAGNVWVGDKDNNRVQKFAWSPRVALVSDVGNDQGRSVQLRVLRSSADSPHAGITITGYEVYRRNDALPGAAPALAGISAGARDPGPAAAQLAGWTYLGAFPAHGESEYSVVEPTLADATPATAYYSAFMVRAVTTDPFTFIDSGAELGMSVDNLPPGAPTPFLAAAQAGVTYLHWSASAVPDFSTFRLYRGVNANFLPDASNLVAAVPDTGYAEPTVAGSWYKLSAVDRNGNESPYAAVATPATTDVELPLVVAFALGGVNPNPCRGRELRVRFALPTAEAARLELLDVGGRSVRERAVGGLGAGPHELDLAAGRRLPAGLYFVRLSQGASVRTARVTVID
jgi:DNA-binding beta-propeller fold protein YncE